jgi:hypothetical protein
VEGEDCEIKEEFGELFSEHELYHVGWPTMATMTASE